MGNIQGKDSWDCPEVVMPTKIRDTVVNNPYVSWIILL